MTCSRASKTHLAALFRTDRFTVQPVAMSVTVRVKQNSPKLLPPSWPTRSISTNPGTASSHSAQVRIGIWDFSSVPGLVWDRPRGISLARSPAEFAVDRRGAHAHQQTGLLVGELNLPVAAQQRHQDRQHRGQQPAGRGPQHRPALDQGRQQIRPVDRCPARPGPDDLQDQGLPQGRPGVVAVPAGQLDQLVQDPGLPCSDRRSYRRGPSSSSQPAAGPSLAP